MRRVLDDVIRRRRSGEILPDSAVLEQHPALATRLTEELTRLNPGSFDHPFSASSGQGQATAGPTDATVERSPDARIAAAASGGGRVADNTGLNSLGDRMPGEGSRHAGPVEIDGYRLLDQLGEGGMGVVWRAEQTSARRLVALKLMTAGRFSSERARTRFQREIELAARLEHPHIARVYASGTHRGIPYYAMELVPGLRLDSFVYQHRLSQRDIVRLLALTCRAVQHAHQRGVIHRDLKPSNILVTPGPDGAPQGAEPHVLDFGLAKTMLDSDQGVTVSLEGEVAGTLAYMSPEQAAGKRDQIDTRSDVFSLGVILFELLAGTLPHSMAGSHLEILSRIAKEEAPRARRVCPAIDRELDALLGKALALDPAARYASAGELAQDLENYLAGNPLAARAPTLGYIVSRKARKHRRAIALAGLILLTVASLLVAVSRFRAEAQRSERKREAARIVQEQLRSSTWSVDDVKAIDTVIADVARIDPALADTFRQQANAALAAVVAETLRAPQLDAEGVARVERLLALLEARDKTQVPALRQSLLERSRAWRTVFDLRPPFADYDRWLIGQAAPAATRASATGDAADEADTGPATGDLRFEARFAPDWDRGTRQLIFYVHRPLDRPFDGSLPTYQFILEVADMPGVAPFADFAAARAGKGEARLTIRSPAGRLRERRILMSDITQGELRLRATRENERLEAQVNDLEPLETRDTLPLPPRGGYFVQIPMDRTLAIIAQRRSMPRAPSPLERADGLFAAGRFEEALPLFAEQSLASKDPKVARAAGYKQALCLLRLNRPTDAAPRFELVFNQSGDQWSLLSGCQLWLIYQATNRGVEAEAVVNGFRTRFSTQDFARVVPLYLHDQVVNVIATEGMGLGLLLGGSAAKIPAFENLVRIEDLFADNMNNRLWVRQWLQRAYQFAGRPDEAVAVGDEMVAIKPPSIYAPMLIDCQLHSGRVLRLQGKTDRALSRLNALLVESPPDNPLERAATERYRAGFGPLLNERARDYAALGRLDDALLDLDTLANALHPGGDNFFTLLEAQLIRGFLLEKKGDAAGALKAWRQAQAIAIEAAYGPENEDRMARVGSSITRMLLMLLAGVLSDELTPAQGQALLAHTTQFTKAVPMISVGISAFGELAAPVSRRAWQSPRGHEWARRIVMGEASLAESNREPIGLMLYGLISITLDGERTSPARDEQMYQSSRWLSNGWIDARFNPAVPMQLFMAWKGLTNNLGWDGAAATMPPEARAHAAYLMAFRFMKLGQPAQARKLFQTAVDDAPADSPLRSAAKAELEAVK